MVSRHSYGFAEQPLTAAVSQHSLPGAFSLRSDDGNNLERGEDRAVAYNSEGSLVRVICISLAVIGFLTLALFSFRLCTYISTGFPR